MKSVTVYKKFEVLPDGRLTSWSPPMGCQIYYTPGEWIKPKLRFSKIFVFPSKKEAIDYDYQARKFAQVWECEGVNLSSIARVGLGHDIGHVCLFWNYFNFRKNLSERFADYYVGYAGVSKIKLVKKVWEQ